MDVPWRREFEAARDPYTARIALGITSTGGGPFQPEDADLTSIAGYGGTGTWLYRSAADTWSAVTIGTGLSFSGGTLSATAGPTYTDEQAQDAIAAAFAAGTHTAITVTYDDTANSFALVNTDRGSTAVTTHEAASDPHPQYLTAAEGAAAYQPLDADLTSLAAASSTNAIYYRSAANTWGPISIGSGLTFSSGTLDAPLFTSGAKGEVPASGGGTSNFLRADGTWTAPAGGGDVTQAGNNTFTGQNYFAFGANLPVVVGHIAAIAAPTNSLQVHGTNVRQGLSGTRWSNDTGGAELQLLKSRGGSIGTNAVVSSGDTLGKLSFAGNHGTGFQAGGPAVSGVCNSAPFGTNTPGYVLIEATSIGGALVTAATFKDTGCAILGTNTNDSAAAGFVGEYISAEVLVGSAVGLANGTAANLTSFSLTAGDWDVCATVNFTIGSTAQLVGLIGSISQTSATADLTSMNFNRFPFQGTGEVTGSGYLTVSIGPTRKLLSATTQIYLVALASWASSTVSAWGLIRARRIR